MIKFLQSLHPVVLLLIATILEVTGDAIIRKSMYDHTGTARVCLGIMGAVLVFGYGFFLNVAPVEFGRIVGLYIATLFIVWQVINYIAFREAPSLPVITGGLLVVTGGLIITFWKNQ